MESKSEMLQRNKYKKINTADKSSLQVQTPKKSGKLKIKKGPRVGPNWSEYSKSNRTKDKLRSANILASVTKSNIKIVLTSKVLYNLFILEASIGEIY
ncbi:hypothetical protein Avbf_03554 [Armadillidium vulgare]|nr:hypothetical protein Avbf_03554 [Armadillidium vulgare]